MKNEIDFFLRNTLRFSRKNYQEKGVHLETFLDPYDSKAQSHIHSLLKRYNFHRYLKLLAPQSLVDNLVHLELLDALRNTEIPQTTHVLDIGSKNFAYCLALRAFLKSKGIQQTSIEGIELDVNRLYSNFYNRTAYAKYYCDLDKNASYHSGDFIRWEFKKKFGLITLFSPFVTIKPLINWGLPRRFFAPEKCIEKIQSHLVPNGRLVVTNPSFEEFAQFLKLSEKKLQLVQKTPLNYSISNKGSGSLVSIWKLH